MADTDAITHLPTAGAIWEELEREDKRYQFDEAIADQIRRIEFVDAKIRAITLGREAIFPGREQK